MRVGDKVICINHNNGGWLSKNDSLIKGKVYEVIEEVIYHFSSADTIKGRIRVKEKGNSWYPTELFVTQEQWREQQLNQLGI
jgi:hypothetical protein